MNDRRVLGSVYDDIEKLAVFPEMGVDILAKYGIISDYLCLITHKNCVFYRIDGETDLTERLNMAKECNARCVLETKTIEALKRSVELLEKTKGGILFL